MLGRMWLGVLLPPVGWIADLLVKYGAIRWANVHDRHWPLVAATLLGAVMAVAGGALSWRTRRLARRASLDTIATMATWGLAMAAYFLLLVCAQAFPSTTIGPREIT